MKIKVNGQEQELASGISLADLLKVNAVKNPDMVSVQVNGEFVDKADFATETVKDNDEIDFLYFMGGGSR